MARTPPPPYDAALVADGCLMDGRPCLLRAELEAGRITDAATPSDGPGAYTAAALSRTAGSPPGIRNRRRHGSCYTYDDAELDKKGLPWINSKPTRLSPGVKGSPAMGKQAAPEFPLTLSTDQVLEVPGVAVPPKEAGKELVLVIEGIEYDPLANNKFDVAINVAKEDAFDVGPQHCEYAGSFTAVPSSKDGGGGGGTLLGKISPFIDGVLADLGATGNSTVDVTIVPRSEGEIKIYLPPTIENA